METQPNQNLLPIRVAGELIPAGTFVTDNAGRFSQHRGRRAQQITGQLALTPVQYDNVLDAITLLRGMLPVYAGVGHYALLLQQQRIIAWVYLPVPRESYQVPGQLNHQEGRVSTLVTAGHELRQSIRTLNIDRVVLATKRIDYEYLFDEDELADIDRMDTSLKLLGGEFLDWLLLYPDANLSRAWAEYEQDGLDEGVTVEVLEEWGIKSDQQSGR